MLVDEFEAEKEVTNETGARAFEASDYERASGAVERLCRLRRHGVGSMGKKKSARSERMALAALPGYDEVLSGVVSMLEAARHASARAVNSVMTGTYWEIGRRIVESEQRGAERAGYGTRLVERLSRDLTARFGRGFGVVNVTQM